MGQSREKLHIEKLRLAHEQERNSFGLLRETAVVCQQRLCGDVRLGGDGLEGKTEYHACFGTSHLIPFPPSKPGRSREDPPKQGFMFMSDPNTSLVD